MIDKGAFLSFLSQARQLHSRSWYYAQALYIYGFLMHKGNFYNKQTTIGEGKEEEESRAFIPRTLES
jgi:hypothetical protein